MRRVALIGTLVLVGGLGCTPKTPALPEGAEIPLVQATPACEEKPPIYVEVPVPVPMPCQLKPLPQPVRTSKRGKRQGGVQRVANTNAAARHGPAEGQGVNAIQVYPYMPGGLYQVYGALTSVTTILLQPREKITSYAGGDTERWMVEQTTTGSPDGERPALLVKPKWPDTKTTLTITTNKRLYLLELHSTPETYHAAVSWEYPQEALQVMRNPQEPVKELPVVAQRTPEQLNFNYTITSKKPVRWHPTHVFDDGRQTFIKFPVDLATMEAPVLFLRSPEGTTQLVNYRTKGTMYIVDRLFDSAELRLGEKKPLVVTITRTGQAL